MPEGVWTPTPHAIHAILLARRGATRLTLTEIEETINENARHNLARNGATTPPDGGLTQPCHPAVRLMPGGRNNRQTPGVAT